jgi:hypothetical protein
MEKQKSFLIVLASVIVIAMLAFWIGAKKSTVPNIANYEPMSVTDLPGAQVSTGTWDAGQNGLFERLKAMGLPALSSEGTAQHTHQHIDIFIHGKEITVPSGIGIGSLNAFISEIHTHEQDQVIHVESPVIKDFTLGQFFDVWGVKFSAQSVGGYNSDAQNLIKVFVNGKEQTGNPRAIVLEAHQEIVVTYGTSSELPKIIPASYKFADGE